jgi:ribose transport system substrate-binding protein
MRRKFSLTVLLALLLVSLMPVAAQDGPAIALLLPLSNNEYVRNAALGVQEIIEGAGGSVAEFDAGFNLEEQINQIQDAITSGNFDAIILYTVDGVGITVGVDMAWEAGLPVIALDAAINADRKTLVPYKYVAGQIARTGDGDGGHIGQAIVMACEMVDPCEVAFMIGFEGFPLDLDRFQAVEAILDTHDHIEIVALQAASYTNEHGFEVSTDMLQANPNIDVIASVGDQMTLGAELAVEDAGLTGQVALVGNGASIDGYNAVKEGRFFATVANIPYTNGQIAAQMALQAISGDLIIRSVNMYDQAPPFPASGPIITQDNYEDFTPQW